MTKRNFYSYKGSILSYMSRIDLSSNKLDGEIPDGLGNLSEIRALNLSHNYLIGTIPETFSNLRQIESLDLSYNNLGGRIPTCLIKLDVLEVFSVAHNNLIAPIVTLQLPMRLTIVTTDEREEWRLRSEEEGSPQQRRRCWRHRSDDVGGIFIREEEMKDRERNEMGEEG
ncbi:unnamed protein product [Fraxinus pennsylvanica]|uniref:Leucine-rich repeat protein n=1 Tax=Fraxinus pennsylvanica TaxID=56036 RepID=A0AAD1Z832_9LAMI|nr:unnamed protein product [Fraxinus pennsylvanica]